MIADTPRIRVSRSPFAILALFLVVIGTISRIAPLFNQEERLYTELPTEDGYLMLTVARNMALGHGLSTSDGHIPTNGVQPLATFVYAGLYALAGGDRNTGLLLSLIAQVVAGAVTAFLLWRLARQLLADHPAGDDIAMLGTATWYASRRAIQQTTNCLETGFLTLFLLIFCICFVRARGAPGRPAWGASLVLGALIGIGFWIRNDVIFLGAALAVTMLVLDIRASGRLRLVPLGQILLLTAVAVVVASPWMMFNQVKFGRVVPVSGVSEALEARFGGGLDQIPASLTEQLLPFAPIVRSLERSPFTLPVWTVVSIAGIILAWRFVRRSALPALREVGLLIGIYGLALTGFYGLFFGATHFMNRYLFPLSVFSSLVFAGLIVASWTRARGSAMQPLAGFALVALAAVNLGMHADMYARGTRHPHRAMIEWPPENVPPSSWVGAYQSGMLGYFHDRTINLDGKLNPEALEARLGGRINEYILEKTIDGRHIEYLVDSAWMADVAKRPELAPHFRVLIKDVKRDLGAAVRIDLPGAVQGP